MDKPEEVPRPPESGSLGDYYNASQLRADTWTRLKSVAVRLASAQSSGVVPDDMRQEAARALELLTPIESYWAFPGHDACQHLRKLLDKGDFISLGNAVARIVRALMSNSYRRRAVPIGLLGEADDEEEEALEAKDEHLHTRPYFEVIIVDNMSSHHEHQLRLGLREVRRHEDPFIYETVVVPSFEDALIGVLFNHNVQAVVVRYGFPLRSRHKLEILQRHLSRVGDCDLGEIPLDEYGVALSKLIGKLRPELDVYLVTDQSVEDIAGRVGDACRRVFYNQEDYMELHLNILRGVNRRYETPFFTALKAFSKQPTGVFHAKIGRAHV